jgi:hypothetical protein
MSWRSPSLDKVVRLENSVTYSAIEHISCLIFRSHDRALRVSSGEMECCLKGLTKSSQDENLYPDSSAAKSNTYWVVLLESSKTA